MDLSKENVIIIDGIKYYPVIKKCDCSDKCRLKDVCYTNFDKQLCSIYDKDAYFVSEEEYLELSKKIKK